MSEELTFKKCLSEIESRLQWGPSAQWTNYDFERLSLQIEEKTGVLLSVTTLKRIWGKVKYNHSPTLTTLNALAKFVDFDDWRAFSKNQLNINEPAPETEDAIKAEETAAVEPSKKSRKLSMSLILGLVLLGAGSFFIFSQSGNKNAGAINSNLFQFSADKVMSDGVPNSVVFTYDAQAAHTDSVYIVQTWDINRKTLVSKTNNKHSAIYYYPGFFRTKLIVDKTVVKTHDLQINSKGWLCLVESEPMPLYFKPEDFQKKDWIEIDSNTLHRYKLSVNPEVPKVRFFNQRDLGDLMNDNFIFETTVKNEFDDGTNSCHFMQVLIQCKDDIIIIPLAAKACVGDIFLYAAGKELISKESDLSGFGADLNQWVTLRVETVNKKMSFYVNGNLASSFNFPNEPSGIVGLQYRFNAVGAVKNTWFQNQQGKILMD